MPRRKKEKVEEISDKIEYLGIDLENIPKELIKFEPLDFRISRNYDGKQYRQYRFLSVNDIEILLSPTNRLDDLQERYKKARPLSEYLDSKSEENILKYTTFLNMLKNMNIEDVEKIAKEQSKLNKELPFKVKYQGNYLWQVYYSENTDKYFMIVPTEETDFSTFFYLLKKKLEKKKTNKIFVPISNIQYSNNYIKRTQFTDIENCLWIFTKDWPLIYEVYDKKEELSIHIVGETNIYENVKSPYKIELKSQADANKFYKLIKALFILHTELSDYFQFSTNINDEGSLELYLGNEKVEYESMTVFIREQYKRGLLSKRETNRRIKEYSNKLEKLKQIVSMQEIEYLAKEKQISTFLECKKSFFGKVKYFFKYNKKSNKKKEEDYNYENLKIENKYIELENIENSKNTTKIPIKKVYTLEELIINYKELEMLEKNMKNLLMDLNALKLKNKNMEKKIENATKYIEEIDSHKKSIFEFWKYSNKDEMASLPEGEEEEINVIKRIERTFDYEQDLEELGKKLDKIQRKNLSKEDTDSIYIASTNLIDILNKIKTNTITPEEIEKNLKQIKREANNEKTLTEEEFDIFGNLIEDTTKIKKINNTKHREIPKDKFSILDINKNTKTIGYKLTLENINQIILKALEKVVIPKSLPVYKAIIDNRLDNKAINVFNVNPELEMKDAIKEDSKKINFYKINIKEGSNGVGFTNCIFYDNQNKTLPVGMDLSTKMIVDVQNLHFNLIDNRKFKVISFVDESDDFSDFFVNDVEVFEFDIVVFEEELKNV